VVCVCGFFGWVGVLVVFLVFFYGVLVLCSFWFEVVVRVGVVFIVGSIGRVLYLFGGVVGVWR